LKRLQQQQNQIFPGFSAHETEVMNNEDSRALRSAAPERPALRVLGSALLLLASACTAIVDGKQPGDQSGPPGQTSAGGTSAGMPGPVSLSNGGPKLRILTQSEYTNSLSDLLGPISAPLDLPPDTFVAGFAAIGGAEVTINASAVEQYETASRAAAAEVFADAARWQKLVGCQPKADLSDACVVTFVQSAGKRAFRRNLTDAEVQQWLQVGKDIAQASTSATQGLMAITTGLLQSPYFLYRVETNKLDASSGRLKYDGQSMATRLAFLLTGHPPSDALLAAAAAGQLDTPDGVKKAAAPLLNDSSVVDRMASFFSEFSQAQLVSVVQKSPDLFPTFNPALQSSMLQATQLFIKNIVLAPGADVRSFFDSDQTFVDASLAPIYGVPAPASGFAQIKLGPETGRAGILGQAAVLAGHSQPDHNSPTRRGVFLLETFLCLTPNSPPAGVIQTLPDNPTLTSRQKMEQHRSNPSCASCHALFDPLGFGLEHFDSIGQFRATEGTLPIDATGALDGVAFDGEAQMGAAVRQSSKAMTCMMNNFYRNANGVLDATADSNQIDAITQTLGKKGYVWRDFLAEFIVSDAFRSAPAAVDTAGNQ
jgi:Protein of unknown function (DUF1588)/Protein of unknown function (DUF1592)/Protein of unknown function (DUF1595)/Protein of unknown function (DUF1587)